MSINDGNQAQQGTLKRCRQLVRLIQAHISEIHLHGHQTIVKASAEDVTVNKPTLQTIPPLVYNVIVTGLLLLFSALNHIGLV